MGKNLVLAVVVSFFAICAVTPIMAAEGQSAQKTTLDNLMTAYDGESNARARYLEFAKKADEEGYGAVASLFRAAAEAEKIHLERHAGIIKSLGGEAKAVIETPVVKTTKENLESAVAGETYENKTMYPEFLKQAEKEKIAEAIDAFEDAGAAEGVHANLYKNALANLDKMKGPKKEFFVCPLCGNVVDSLPGLACPICMTDTNKFIPVS